MKQQQMKQLISKACSEGLKKNMKIRHLEYQISFGDFNMNVSFSLN